MILFVFSSKIMKMLKKHRKSLYGSSLHRDFSMTKVKTTLRRPAGAGADFLYTLLTTIGDRAHGYGRRPFYQVKSPKFVNYRNVRKCRGEFNRVDASYSTTNFCTCARSTSRTVPIMYGTDPDNNATRILAEVVAY